jgi:predicted RNA-binding Zn-ribbon protein involved in translation (DUF1610 family)
MKSIIHEHAIDKEVAITTSCQIHEDYHKQHNFEEQCPDCGSMLIPDGRCRYCAICGWSFC